MGLLRFISIHPSSFRIVLGVQELVGTAAIEDLVAFVANEAGRTAFIDMIRTFVNALPTAQTTNGESSSSQYHEKQF